MKPFEKNFDLDEWLGSIADYKYFGEGVATIYLNRIDRNKYCIVNNKTIDALEKLGFKFSSKFIDRYHQVESAQKKLISKFPLLKNFYKTDALNHFLIGTDEGARLLENDQQLGWIEERIRKRNDPVMVEYRKKVENELKSILNEKAGTFTPVILDDFCYKLNDDYYDGREVNGRFGQSFRGNNVNNMKLDITLINDFTQRLWKCDEDEVTAVLKDFFDKKPKGAGTGYPTAILYLKDPYKYNIWVPKMYSNVERELGLVKRENNIDKYLVYNSVLNEFRDNNDLEPQVIDAIFSGDFENVHDIEKMGPIMKKSIKNVILFGPPGTGKTFILKKEYFPKYTEIRSSMSKQEMLIQLARKYPWWQLISAAVLDLESASVTEILNHGLIKAKIAVSSQENPRAMIWAMLQQHAALDCEYVKYTRRTAPNYFYKTETSIWSIDRRMVENDAPEVIEILKESKVERSGVESEILRYNFITFHQSYSYEEFVEGIKPVVDEIGTDESSEMSYKVEPGIFMQLVNMAKNDPEHDYALFIDEINRGNISKIFGELITLIEEDKRIGEKNELTATLPYSKKPFGVPSNLHIIGTMNTADRSIALMDTALRRRFAFIEIIPDVSAISHINVAGVEPGKLLEVMNKRIEYLYDRDHRIGHAYFVNIGSFDDLKEVFRNRLFPLLQEYFYDDWEKIRLVLNDHNKMDEGKQFVLKVGGENDGKFRKKLFGSKASLDEYEARALYKINEDAFEDPGSYTGIYSGSDENAD